MIRTNLGNNISPEAKKATIARNTSGPVQATIVKAAMAVIFINAGNHCGFCSCKLGPFLAAYLSAFLNVHTFKGLSLCVFFF